ncbi:hypothetical protein Trydic_g17678 [Trypoxylus dichotomus]
MDTKTVDRPTQDATNGGGNGIFNTLSSGRRISRVHSHRSQTWVRHPESKKDSMATVFCGIRGIMPIEFLPLKTTVKSDIYCQALEKLHQAIQQERKGRLTNGFRLLHDNAKLHTSN